MKAAVVRAFGEPLVVEERPGPGPGTVQVPIFDTVLNGTSVIGPIVGTRQDLAEVLRGQVKVRIVFDLGTGR